MAVPEPDPKPPKAFISYSWDDDAHKEWVRQLATRLRANGVDVTLDQWHAEPGDQIPAFMERAVRENNFVIAVCTPKFKERSDEREGGAGYEGDIMTAYVFTGGNEKKCIPVLRRGNWNDAAPMWLLGRAKIDLSGDPYSQSEYEKLLRTLHGAREEAPPVGPRPNFLDPEEANVLGRLMGVDLGTMVDADLSSQLALKLGFGYLLRRAMVASEGTGNNVALWRFSGRQDLQDDEELRVAVILQVPRTLETVRIRPLVLAKFRRDSVAAKLEGLLQELKQSLGALKSFFLGSEAQVEAQVNEFEARLNANWPIVVSRKKSWEFPNDAAHGRVS